MNFLSSKNQKPQSQIPIASKMLIVEEFSDVDTGSGKMRIHIWRPKSEDFKFPALAFFSEIFQVSGPIRRTAADFAGQGYIVGCPEVYHETLAAGTALPYTPEGTAEGNKLKTEKDLSATDDDAKALISFLKLHPFSTGRVGSLGICYGGGLAFRCGMLPDVKATCTIYGTDLHKKSLGKGNDDTLDRSKEIKGALCCIWGRQDPHVPREGRRMIYEALSDASVNFEWIELNGVHAFMRDESSYGRYDPELAQLSLGIAFAFYRRNLGGNVMIE